jgi:hypothetical protein
MPVVLCIFSLTGSYMLGRQLGRSLAGRDHVMIEVYLALASIGVGGAGFVNYLFTRIVNPLAMAGAFLAYALILFAVAAGIALVTRRKINKRKFRYGRRI